MLEIQFEFAKNSELTFTVGGRHLCSSVNPTREAQQWLDCHRADLKGVEGAIVLGVGCGYHLRALQSVLSRRVICVEPQKALIAAALKIHPLDLNEREIVCWSGPNTTLSSAELSSLTSRPYAVVIHEASAFAEPERYQTTREFLLGRSAAGLRWLFGNRGMEVPTDEELKVAEAMSLRSLDLYWEQRSPVQPLLRAVRELIV